MVCKETKIRVILLRKTKVPRQSRCKSSHGDRGYCLLSGVPTECAPVNCNDFETHDARPRQADRVESVA